MTSVLATLRAVPAPAALRDVERMIRDRARGDDDVVQEALIRVVRYAPELRAANEPAAKAWLRRVVRSAQADLVRREARPRMTSRHVAPAGDETAEERLVVARAQAELEAFLEELLGRVRRKGRGEQPRNARLSIAHHVRGQAPSALPWDGTRDALYKGIQRGRDEVLLPLLADDPRPMARHVEALLLRSRRRDHGTKRGSR